LDQPLAHRTIALARAARAALARTLVVTRGQPPPTPPDD
jgi:hypothetical protein